MAATTRKHRSQPPAQPAVQPPAPAPPAAPQAPAPAAEAPVQAAPPTESPVYRGDWLALLFWIACALLLALLLLADLLPALLRF
jgi:hypothetical protein